ncbi:unnamed protein product [Sphagnum balticum]
MDPGTNCGFGQPTTRYYYNMGTGQCMTFTYSGCGGNGNNFLTSSACQQACAGSGGGGGGFAQQQFGASSSSSSCPFGTQPWLNPGTGQPAMCAGLNGCPNG